jgi:hypothetical protein
MRFRIIVHARTVPEEAPLRGFLTARSVDAPSAAFASEMALALVRDDPRVAGILVDWKCLDLRFEVDEVIELSRSDDFDLEPQGFIFYDESVGPSRAS